jgi:predicted metal-dependent hydrolase
MNTLAYDIVRSAKRRKLTITVERDRGIVVRAPAGLSDSDIERVVNSKRRWILAKLRHPQKYQTRRHPPGKEVVNGEAAPYLGRDYRIEIAETESGEVEFAQQFLVPPKRQAKRRKVLRDWYIARAKDKILHRVEQHARTLGVTFGAARIVDNRYRWGSCTVKDNVNFNWRLIKAPMFVIDYVIVHELAHLLETNHTARFWGIIRAHTPSMGKARAWLKERGQMLEEEV